jgi:hypothetical protein
MAMWELDVGRRSGQYNMAMIERQLQLTRTQRPY